MGYNQFIVPPLSPVADADLELLRRIGVAWRELRRGAAMGRLQERFNGAGARALDQGQVDLLDVLVQRDGWRMAELADAMRVDASTATRSVDRLVAARLAVRSTSSEDGRVVIVSASPAGRARQGEVSSRRIAALQEMLSKFSAPEQKRFAEYLERLVAALDEVTAPDGG